MSVSSAPKARLGPQRGLSLLVVMVVLVLGSLLALGSARMVLLNEKLVSAQSDQQRALAAAHALLRDAQNDIRGERTDGSPCSTLPGDRGCRGSLADMRPFFPADDSDMTRLAERIGPGQTCRDGICLPRSVTALQPQAFAALLMQEAASGAGSTIGARYGQFTGASAQDQALLGGVAAKAWYWVEVFRYDTDQAASESLPAPDASHPFIYRINAYVQGHKAGTRVWLRSLFIRPSASREGSRT